MTAITSHLRRASVASAILMLGTLLAEGCGSTPCSETDTCSEPPDGASDGTTLDSTAQDSTQDTKRTDGTSADVRATDTEDAPGADAEGGPDSMEDAVEVDSPGELDASADVASDSGPDRSPDAPLDASPDAPADGPTDTGLDVLRDAASDTAGDVATDTNDGCSSVVENCTNGIDDNCNGLIDCADPECVSQGFTCVPPWAGTGWSGPVVLYDGFQTGGPAPSAISCASAGLYTEAPLGLSTPELGHYDSTAANPTCGCTCGASVQGVSCTSTTVTLNTVGCTDNGTTVSTTPTATCSIVTNEGSNSITVTLGTASGGSCLKNETGLPPPAWNSQTGWEGTGSGCWTGRATSSYFGGAHGGCTGSNVCVEPPPTAFNGGAVCVFFDGVAACPTGYANEHDFFSGGTDTRSCEYSCTCTPAGVACTADVTLSTQSTCSGTQTLSNLASGCTNLSNFAPAYVEATFGTTGSCTFGAGALTGGAAATGSVTPTGQVTVCCDK